MRKEIIYLIMTVMGGLLLLGTTVFTCIMWQQVPDQIPLHYDLSGNVTAYGGKGSMILLLVIAWVSFVGMTVLVLFPNKWNIPVKVTAENAERLYSITRGLLETVKFLVALFFVFIVITTIIGVDFPEAIFMILVGALLISVVAGMFMMHRNK